MYDPPLTCRTWPVKALRSLVLHHRSTKAGHGDGGPLQPSLFCQRDLAEIASPDFSGERLIAHNNPLLAEERARKCDELLAKTEAELVCIEAGIVTGGPGGVDKTESSSHRPIRTTATASRPQSLARLCGCITCSAAACVTSSCFWLSGGHDRLL